MCHPGYVFFQFRYSFWHFKLMAQAIPRVSIPPTPPTPLPGILSGIFHLNCRPWSLTCPPLSTFVSGLHNCLEFSHPLSRFYQAMQTPEKSFLLLLFFLWHLLNVTFLPVAKSCTRRLARVISSCFVKKSFSE